MATTGFWPVKGNLKAVIDYADNPDKTTERKYLDDDLAQALEYVANDDKTDRKMYVSGVNCTKDRAYEEMMAVQRRFGLRGTNVAYHGFQSFRPGEVTPEEAHQIGIETARRMWGDKYQVVVTTHLNTNSVHNHMVVHAVSFKDGKKFQNHVRDHFRLREISDQICREHRLSVLEDAPFFGDGKGVYWAHKAGKLTHRDQLRNAVEHSLYYAVTTDEFFDQLEGLGYEIDYDRLSVKAPAWERSIRLDRLGYPMETIYRRLTQSFYRPGSVAEINENPPYRPKVLPLLRLEQQLAFTVEHSRSAGVVMVDLLFLILIQLLKLTDADWSWEERCRPLSPEVRIELERLDQYTAMTDLMAENDIHTDIDLMNYIESVQSDIATLEKERQGYRNQLRREKDPEKAAALKEQAKAVSKKLFPLRRKLKTARQIEDRLPVVRKALEAEKQAELDARERYPRQFQTERRRYER